MTPLHQNSQTSSGPWEWAFSRPGTCRRGPWSQLTYPTIRLFCWANPENFSLFHAADQKLFHFYHQTDRQTHRHTDTQTHILHPYMHGRDFFLYGNLYLSQHYVSEWAWLTHSLRLWRIRPTTGTRLKKWKRWKRKNDAKDSKSRANIFFKSNGRIF